MKAKITDKAIESFCRSKYYTDETTLWEPFEGYSEKQIEEMIAADVISLKDFLKTGGVQLNFLK